MSNKQNSSGAREPPSVPVVLKWGDPNNDPNTKGVWKWTHGKSREQGDER